MRSDKTSAAGYEIVHAQSLMGSGKCRFLFGSICGDLAENIHPSVTPKWEIFTAEAF